MNYTSAYQDSQETATKKLFERWLDTWHFLKLNKTLYINNYMTDYILQDSAVK